VRHVLPHPLVRLDLVEQVPAVGELEAQPDPGGVFAVAEVADDVVVGADEAVQGELDVQLFGAQAAGAEGVLFVDEFDGDDGVGGVAGDCFADAEGGC